MNRASAILPDHEIVIDYDMYNPVYIPFLSNPHSTEILYGGSSSGKSVFIAQRAIEEVMEGGHNYLCCRKRGNSVTKSVFNELEKAITRLGVNHLFNVVPSQGHITCANGYQILFTGLDDVEKVKSITPKLGVITDIWVEEATETAREDIKQLRKRLRGMAVYLGRRIKKRIILSFNPIYKTHWIVKEYFTSIGWRDDQNSYEDGNGKLRILKTTHLDNEFLDPEDHEELETESDPYWYQVYTLGNWGILGDAILTNWRVADLSSLAAGFDRIRNGLDFGYSSDPTAFTRSHYDRTHRKIYVFKGFGGLGMTNPMIADQLRPIIGGETVWCDSAEPKSIQELRDAGLDARGVKKGPDSLLYSIKWLQKHEIIVDESLQELVNELNTWQWKKDKDGNSTTIPQGDDHYIDSIRYGHEIEYASFFGDVL
jgi:phage terminase large subunit